MTMEITKTYPWLACFTVHRHTNCELHEEWQLASRKSKAIPKHEQECLYQLGAGMQAVGRFRCFATTSGISAVVQKCPLWLSVLMTARKFHNWPLSCHFKVSFVRTYLTHGLPWQLENLMKSTQFLPKCCCCKFQDLLSRSTPVIQPAQSLGS